MNMASDCSVKMKSFFDNLSTFNQEEAEAENTRKKPSYL